MDDTFPPRLCVGCNRSLDFGSGDVVRIQIGEMLGNQMASRKKKLGRPRSRQDEFNPKSLWGLMHLMCFLRAVDSAESVFAELGG